MSEKSARDIAPGSLDGALNVDEAFSSGLLTRREIVRGMNAALLTLGSGALLPAPGQDPPAAHASTRIGPHKVREIENVWIPMPDGIRIAARIWLPEDAERNPVPAVLEYIPYRKRDSTRLGDETRHPYLASHGYACIRPDIRGAGDSEGLPLDEYEKQEQDDGLEIIAWAAKQPWCTGKVGMFGISWGGFSALQVAARRPPALAAIITHCSTDDRYTDDAHYIGGCIVQDMFVWGSMHTTNGARPPDPAIVGSRWREMWRQRLENLDFYVANWMSHPHRDEFWKHGSVNEDYSQITCAVYAVGGWVDPYSIAIPRMLAGLKGPRKGLVGPWGHQYPHQGNPGPAIHWLNEALRWWDYWLKGIDTGIMKEPMYRVWMQNETAMIGATEISGRWVAEDSWPSSRIRTSTYHLNDGTLGSEARPESQKTLWPFQAVGTAAPHWCPFNMKAELPSDQRIDDARSLTFDSAPLETTLEILGAPFVELDLSVDQPVAFLAVRLNEITAENVSRRVTYGVLNLCHRDGHESPQPLAPGKRYRIRVPLRDIAHVFKRGNRMRVAISTTYWPLIWPSPQPVTLKLFTGGSTLALPVRPPRSEDAKLAQFGPAFVPEDSGTTVIDPASGAKTFEWDVASQRLVIRSDGTGGRYVIKATGTEMSRAAASEVLQVLDGDPNSASLECRRGEGFKRGDWDVRVETVLRMSLTRDEFLLVGEIETFDHDEVFFTRKWERPIRRRLL